MTELKPVNKRYIWLVVAMLWVVAFLNYFDRNMIASMHDPIVNDFGLNDAQFGLLTSVFLWVYGILSPFSGFLADKYSRKVVIVISVAVWSAVTLWTGYIRSYPEMLAARVCMGVSEACYIPAALALITDYHRGRTRSLATGLHMSGLYAGLALGGLGGYIAEYWGWRYGFRVFGLFGVAYALLLLFFLKDNKMETEQKEAEESSISLGQSFKQFFTDRSFILVMLYFSALGAVNWLVYGWLATFLKEHFHLGLGEAGISATGYIQIGSFAGVLLGGLWADRWSKTNTRGRLYVLVIGFTLGAPFLFIASATSAFVLAITGMAVFGVARGFNDANLMPVLRQITDSRYIATSYGFLNFLSTIVGGIMVYLSGALKDAHTDLSIMYQVCAVLLLLAAWGLLRVKIKPATITS